MRYLSGQHVNHQRFWLPQCSIDPIDKQEKLVMLLKMCLYPTAICLKQQTENEISDMNNCLQYLVRRRNPDIFLLSLLRDQMTFFPGQSLMTIRLFFVETTFIQTHFPFLIISSHYAKSGALGLNLKGRCGVTRRSLIPLSKLGSFETSDCPIIKPTPDSLHA